MRRSWSHPFVLLLVAVCAAVVGPRVWPPSAQASPPVRPYTVLHTQHAESETADTDILPSDLEFRDPGVLAVDVVCGTATVFNVMEDDGTTDQAQGLNESTALNAGDRYLFTILVHPDTDVNFQVETTSTVTLKAYYRKNAP